MAVMDGGWGRVTRPSASGSSGSGVTAHPLSVDPALVMAVLAALGHSQATARTWTTRSVTATTNNPVLVSGDNPKRIGVAVQLPSGLTAYVGPDSQVSAASSNVPGYAGFALPTGGGFLFGPENTLDVWLVHANPAAQDIRVLELFS